MKSKTKAMMAKRLLLIDSINVQRWEKMAHDGNICTEHQLPLGGIIRIDPYVTKPEQMIAAGWAPVKGQ